MESHRLAAPVGGERLPGGVPVLAVAHPRQRAARLARHDQLDPLVPGRAVDAEVGELRASQLDAHEGRREPLDADHLHLAEDEGWGRGGDRHEVTLT